MSPCGTRRRDRCDERPSKAAVQTRFLRRAHQVAGASRPANSAHSRTERHGMRCPSRISRLERVVRIRSELRQKYGPLIPIGAAIRGDATLPKNVIFDSIRTHDENRFCSIRVAKRREMVLFFIESRDRLPRHRRCFGRCGKDLPRARLGSCRCSNGALARGWSSTCDPFPESAGRNGRCDDAAQ
eukprot:ctg_3746.g643